MTEQTNNDSGSRRLRREEERRRLAAEQGLPLPVDLGVERSRRDLAPDPRPVERDWRDDVAPRVSPVERSWDDDLTPRSSPSEQPTLSRRELRERAAAGGSAARPGVDEARATRRVAEPAERDLPAAATPAPATPPERPLSRRELRERAEQATGEGVALRPRQEDVQEPEAQRPDAPAGRRRDVRQGDPMGRRERHDARPDDAPRDTSFGAPAVRRDRAPYADPTAQPDAQQFETQRFDAQRFDAQRFDAQQFDPPADRFLAERPDAPRYEAPVSDWAESVVDRPREAESPYATGQERSATGVEAAEGPTRPAQPTRARPSEAAERGAFQDETRASAPQAEPEAENAPEPAVPDAPVRISPQARAAAIRAQAARVQAEREDATRERYEELQTRRAAQAAASQAGAQPNADASPQPAGQQPAAMWGQRQESNGGPQPAAGADATGYPDRPPVRRVVLPPSMTAGTSPADVPVLGQWQSQPQQYQAAAPPQQQPYQGAAPPQQYQGVPPGGPTTNGQPFATVTMDRGTTQTATAPTQPATGGPGGPPNVDGSGPLPRWGSVGASGAWSPTPSYGPNGQVPVGVAPQAMPGPINGAINGAQPDEDEDEDDTARRHPYTWLHMIVLVLVAFVLGMLIFMLVVKDNTENGAAAAPERVTAASLERVTERVGD